LLKSYKITYFSYQKCLGVVKEVHNKYVGEIEMFDSGDTIKVDQTHCETVIPVIFLFLSFFFSW